jgi:hypothetical protein
MLTFFVDRALQWVLNKVDSWIDRIVDEGQDPRVAARMIRNWFNRNARGVSPDGLLNGAAAAAVKTIVRTETTRELSRQKVAEAGRKGYLVKWNLAPSHPQIDICDPVAEEDIGFGPGVYYAGTAPTPPAHPNCRCYLSTVPMPETR